MIKVDSVEKKDLLWPDYEEGPEFRVQGEIGFEAEK